MGHIPLRTENNFVLRSVIILSPAKRKASNKFNSSEMLPTVGVDDYELPVDAGILLLCQRDEFKWHGPIDPSSTRG